VTALAGRKDVRLSRVGDQSIAPTLDVAGVSKRFGGVQALDDVDLTVAAGSIHGLIGPNGAGKSTLFNVVTGLLAPDEGEIQFKGQNVSGRTLDGLARAGMARTFQSPRGFPSMSVMDSLLFVPASSADRLTGALLHGGRRNQAAEEKAEEVLVRMGLERVRNRWCDELAGGELRLLEIARHLMCDIELLMLDEPTAGVIPAMQSRIAGAIQELAESGIAVLVVEHNLRFVFELASEVAVLVRGRVICTGPPADVQQDSHVAAAYLGSSSQ
jgi:branched-chain amino acid transport system ATP-binding protein